MKFARTGLAAAAVIALAGVAASSAAGDVPRMGDQRVGLIACANGVPGGCDDLTLVAGEAFHVAHGFVGEPWKDLVNPLHRFELTVDGKRAHGAIDLDRATGEKWYVFNFPRGMTGTHSFTGCWYGTDGTLWTCATRTVYFV
jgi:hypothetical protein